jgi:radical SAM superfamily enzyme YgiQ (UPF0313 family)
MPIGQGYVAAAAKMDGHYVEVLDLNANRLHPIKENEEEFSKWVETQVVETLKKRKPDMIGIGGIITQYRRIKEITRICKNAYPEVTIVLGGGIASSLPDFMVERLSIDIAVQQEGEVTFSELLHRLEKGASLEGMAGTAYRHEIRPGDWDIRNNGIRAPIRNLDTLPWPLRSIWPIDEVYKQNPVGHLNWEAKWIDGMSIKTNNSSVSMVASRGCPYSCGYCFSDYLGKKFRIRSPGEIADEMQFLKERYGITYVHFLDDLLMKDYRWVLSLCAELLKRKEESGFEVTWGGTGRTNVVADDVLRARREGRPNILEQAYEVGMRQVGFGIESGSPKILRAIGKSGQTVKKMEIAVRETQRVMGYADCSFMIGSPGETRETVKETVDFCRRVGLQPEVLFFTTAYPATPFWQLASSMGLIRKAVTGEIGPADDDIIEQYLESLGEQGEKLLTNFSDLPDEEIIELSWWAVNELGAQNIMRHPYTKGKEQQEQSVQKVDRSNIQQS